MERSIEKDIDIKLLEEAPYANTKKEPGLLENISDEPTDGILGELEEGEESAEIDISTEVEDISEGAEEGKIQLV